MELDRLQYKRRARVESRDKNRKRAQAQAKKYRMTKKRGHKRAAKKYSRAAKADIRAINKLNRLIAKVKKNSKPSPNFSYSEFDCHNGEKVPRHAYAGLDRLCTEVLEPLRVRFGTVVITSGYRPPAYNASIGGEPNSYHLYEKGRAPAADIYCAKGTPQEWADFAAEHGADGIGVYNGSNFVHLDQRGYSSRWWG